MLPITSYPAFSLEAFTEAARIFRARSFVAEKTLFGLCEYNIQGWLQGNVLGQPGGPFGAEPTDDEYQHVRDLQHALHEYQTAGDFGVGATADASLDPATIAIFAEIVMQLIAMFLKKRNPR